MAIDGDNGTSTVGGGNTGYNWSGYAEWLAKTKNSTKTCNLIVNYYANGYNGSAAENPPPSSVRSYTGQSIDVRLVVEVASGDTMSNPGYVFVGWATSNNTPTVTYNPGDTISNSWAADYRGNSVTNLYAVWTNQNVITYNPDDNSIEKSAIYQVKQSGQSATLKGATFTRTGYTQTGWATTAGGPKVYDLGGTYSSNNPLSLYPVWQANTYTITYVANEGTGTMADQTVTYDSTFTPSACSFIREGYSFSSWNESQDGKGIRWKVQEYTVDRAENITLYAIWKGNEYTVYYDDNYSRYSDEITGNIVTFESEYAQPLKKAEVSLSPIQSLHGYDHPWPAGGSVQLLNIPDVAQTTRNGVTYSIQNGVIYANGTCTGGFTPFSNISVDFASGTYTFSVRLLSGSTSGVNNSFSGYDSSNNRTWLVPFGTNTNPYPSKTTNTSDIRIIGVAFNNGAVFNNAAIAFQIESGSDMSTFRPYSNICPISGRTGLSVYRTGKNLGEFENGYNIVADGSIGANAKRCATVNPIKIFNGISYVFTSETGLQCIYAVFNGNTLVRRTSGIASGSTLDTSGGTDLYVCAYGSSDYTATVETDKPMVRSSSSSSDYEPYNGNIYSVDWTTQAGTVYGGTVDVVTGLLTVDRVCETITKDSAWSSFYTGTGNSSAGVYLQYYQNCKYVDGGASSNGAICSTGKEVPNYWTGPRQNESPGGLDMCFAYSYTGLLRFHRTDVATITDLASFKANFPDTQICYYLATPLTYQLTATQVEALVGTNNVWSDGGPITIVYALDEVPQNMPPSTAIFGDIFYTRRNQLSRFGLTFKGWNTVPDGSGEAWLPSGVSMGTYKRTEDAVWNVSHNVTLYAQWDPNVYPFGTVFFNGRNAQDLGIIVEELPSYYYAERAFNHKQVNGKNGDVILDTGRYENVKKVYKVACYDPSRNFYESAVALSTFLHSAGSDYIRLEDSYEPSSYRMAIYEETNEIENLLGKAGKCEITFNCMPQRFLLSGDEEITIPSSGYSIYNPTAFDAKPMIRIQGTGTVTINGRSVQVTENDNDMLVDCENQNAKDLSGADMNYFIYCDEFPILKPGFNTISYTETIDAVKITPRWWIL